MSVVGQQETAQGTKLHTGSKAVRLSAVLLIALIVLIASLIDDLHVLPGDSSAGQDYNDFYSAALAQQQGINPYSGMNITRIETQVFGHSSFSNTVASPPAFFVVFRPLTALRPERGYEIWMIASAMALLLATRSLCRMLRKEPNLITAMLVLCPPVTITLFLGQISLFLLAVFVGAISSLLAGRIWLAGLLLALSLVKPHLMIVPDALLCGLSWSAGGKRAAASTVLWTVLICVVAIPFSEPGGFGHWFQALTTYGSTFDRWQPDISSLAGIYLPYVPRTIGRVISGLAVVTGLTLAGTLIAGGPREREIVGGNGWWRRLSLGTAAWLALLPYEHPYDVVLLLAPLFWILAVSGWTRPRGLVLAAVLTLVSLPELDLLGFRPNLTFSYTSVPVMLLVCALLAQQRAERLT